MRKLIDFYPDLIKESIRTEAVPYDKMLDEKELARAAVALARSVFGKEAGMLQNNRVIDGQRQIWVDITWPATAIKTQQQGLKNWIDMKSKKVRRALSADKKLKDFEFTFKSHHGGVSLVLVKDEGE